MKKPYEAPEFDVHILQIHDVICTSGIRDYVDDMDIGRGSGHGIPEE